MTYTLLKVRGTYVYILPLVGSKRATCLLSHGFGLLWRTEWIWNNTTTETTLTNSLNLESSPQGEGGEHHQRHLTR
jgi:hypothetical protein